MWWGCLIPWTFERAEMSKKITISKVRRTYDRSRAVHDGRGHWRVLPRLQWSMAWQTERMTAPAFWYFETKEAAEAAADRMRSR
jgi:hypothetical protein